MGQAYATPYITSEAIVKLFIKAFDIYGIPQVIASDNGAAFISKEFKNLIEKNRIRHILTPPYHQAANGIAERYNKTINEALLKYQIETKKSWDILLPGIVKRYNNTIHRITNETPNNIFYKGRDADEVNDQTIRQANYDANRKNKSRHAFRRQPGDLVLVEIPNVKKLKNNLEREGPYRVIKIVGNSIVEIDKENPNTLKKSTIHVDRLRYFNK